MYEESISKFPVKCPTFSIDGKHFTVRDTSSRLFFLLYFLKNNRNFLFLSVADNGQGDRVTSIIFILIVIQLFCGFNLVIIDGSNDIADL